MRKARLLSALTVLALVGCDSGDIGGPDPAAVQDVSLDARGGVASAAMSGSSVGGSGHLTVAGEYRTFSFHAREKKNGEVTGQFNLQARQSPEPHLKGDIACFTVLDDNRAVVAGYMTEISGTFREGGNFGFMVEDNGEGAGASPDRITLVTQFPLQAGFPTDESIVEFLCASDGSNLTALMEIEGGNVQVRP